MNKVKIGRHVVGDNNPCLISLEPGATYTNIDEAKKMIEATAESGADAVKFQTLMKGDSDRIMGLKDIKVDFTTKTGKKQEFVYDALKRRELSESEWTELIQYAKKKDLSFITTALFPETVDFISETDVDAIKVSKGDINNTLLIERIAEAGLPVILDGRERFSDVEIAIKICEDKANDQIVVMHCPSGYPAENAGVHLKAIQAIKKKCDCPVGFADHSPGGIMNYAAIPLGVNMLEKTITMDKTTEKVEHLMSLELEELRQFVKNVRAIEEAIGSTEILEVSRVEENARRSLVAKEDLKSGTKITREILDFRRPGNMGISVSEGFDVIGKTVKKDIPKNTFLEWEMFE